MEYVIKFGARYLDDTGNLTDRQVHAVRVPSSVKPFVNPDAGYRFVRVRPRDTEETETLND